MKTYQFYFAPEGRMVSEHQAAHIRTAKALFYRENPQFKKARGEVYWVVK